MRWLPRSLFSRMVLILLGGLVVAQLLSFAIHWQERGQLLLRTSGMRSAQRIADIVKLLDPLAPVERARIAAVIDSPALRISIKQPPLAAAPGADDKAEQAVRFTALLRRFLPGEWPLVVNVTSAPPPWAQASGRPGAGPMSMGGPGMMHGAMGPGGALGGISFVVQARLTDGTLVTFDSRPPLETAGWPFRLFLSLGVLLVAVVAITLVAVRWVTRPLKTLADAADTLGADIDRPPLDETGPLEVSRAARAFNTMQQRLATFIRDRTRVLAAMSHDLKTPITRLRLRAELLEDPQVQAKFTKDLDEMESMVGASLDFLRGQESGEPVRPVDVMALLESLQADIAEISGTVTIEGGAKAPYPGRPQALKRCLANLLENAVKYGKSASLIVDDDDTRLEIRIQDEGPGLLPAELEKVFEPFYRVEGSRSRETGGTGLGLTIARSVAEAHGGSLVLCNRAEGGLESVLLLPRLAAIPTGGRREPEPIS